MKHLEQFNLSPLVAVTDIESTALTPDAKIGSLGCVVVNVFTGEEVGSFYARADLDTQFGRISDAPTLAFWEQQREANPDAWAELFCPDKRRERLPEVLKGFAVFLASFHEDGTKPQVMGNGPEFDNVILAHAFNQEGLDLPWHFSGNQSLRTAVWFGRLFQARDPKYTLAFEGVKHHALDDARHEAQALLEITQGLAQAMYAGVATVHISPPSSEQVLEAFERVLEAPEKMQKDWNKTTGFLGETNPPR